MNKLRNSTLTIAVLAGLTIFGCGQRAQNAQEAIETAETKTTVEEKTKYLVSQANQFISSKNFDEAIESARYILNKLDADSAEAKSIIEKAQAEIKKLASEKVEGVKGMINNLGN